MGLFNREDKFLRNARKQADKVEALRESMMALDDEALIGKTAEHRRRHQEGESLDSLLPEVFAQVREASRRVLEQEHFYAQILGGVILHGGDIAEMKTGEGKTLAATLPVCLNALSGKGVHVVTVNDYLAKRDSEWMGKLYNFLGYSVGLIIRGGSNEEKRAAYNADVTYGTNNEFGFDYLRDNMKVRSSDLCQRGFSYAIVDEVDSILIDEARTPLIISGAGDKSTELYAIADKFAKTLQEEADYTVDEKQKTVTLSEAGVERAEKFFNVENLGDIENLTINHNINQALKARFIMRRDIDYVVQNGEVLIVDEFTGRLMIGRRYSDGLHQAIEAKEGVKVERESKTLATITFQNYFRMYDKLSGMTGTAKTEEAEFEGIYDIAVVEIPTQKPMIREDKNDIILPTVKAKFETVINEICEVHQTGQPILVGTVSVENSEILSGLLKKRGVEHQVLNAKNHEKEAMIVAQAGQFRAVTIATNMAGRGTDILLGGNPDYMAKQEMRRQGYEEDMVYVASMHLDTKDETVLEARKIYNHLYQEYKVKTDADHERVVAVGGLYILGTERHESRRIDNQLRGRSGRQGDPGASRFYVALEDDLMRLFGGDRMKLVLERISGEETIPLEYGMITKQIERAQKRIEERNYNLRSHVLKYDDVMNKQREIIYGERRKVLMGEDLSDTIKDMRDAVMEEVAEAYIREDISPEYWDVEGLICAVGELVPEELGKIEKKELSGKGEKGVKEALIKFADKSYRLKESMLSGDGLDMREVERAVLLKAVDLKWMDHIDNMDQFRQGIGLRSYGQADPVMAYQKEGFDMFEEMVASINKDTVRVLFSLTKKSETKRVQTLNPTTDNKGDGTVSKKTVAKKVGRNDPCPCGSGKKYKNCHGKNEQ